VTDVPSATPRLELLPAVDVVDGRAVQLVQGVAGSGGEFGDPLEAALRWQEQGAQWLHLVDLDAAFGRGSNAELLATIVGRLDIDVEMSGGIRDEESLARALSTGCRRVNVGTAALEDPEWTARAIAEHGDRVAVAPIRVTPSSITASSASSVRTPPAAFTCTCGEVLARIRRRSSCVAPEGANPVLVLTKSPPAASVSRQARIFSSSVR